jgi:predicted GNAT family N-acyltransferase
MGTMSAARVAAGAAPARLLARIRAIWQRSRAQAARSVNIAHVCANWLIGRQVVEAEQGGAQRAGYGQALLKTLAERLTAEFGAGFSLTALKHMRGFYQGYPHLLDKGHAPRDELSDDGKGHALRDLSTGGVQAWNGWSARQLERQIASLLFERLARSRDKRGVLILASRGLEPTKPEDLIKDPYVLEFLA